MSKSSKIAAALLWSMSLAATAGTVTGIYTPLGGSQWSVAFTATSFGGPEPVSQFTIYFAESLFSGLAVTGSPGTWDSIVIQPDSALPADGFFDALVIDGSNALGSGDSVSGFAMTFAYLGLGTPGSLPFEFLDANFSVIASGQTTISGTGGGSVPEPSTWLLASVGLVAALSRRRPAAALN